MSGKERVLAASVKTKLHERRKHPRYAVRQDALFYNQEHFAEIIDISRGGVACSCMVESDVISPVLQGIDLLDCNGGMFVQGLKCRRIRRDLSGNPLPVNLYQYSIRACYFEFVDLQPDQMRDIEHFISACAEVPDDDVLYQ